MLADLSADRSIFASQRVQNDVVTPKVDSENCKRLRSCEINIESPRIDRNQPNYSNEQR